MSQIINLKTHRAWEDWAMMLVGGLVVLSPAIDPGGVTPSALINSAAVGFLIICIAMSELVLIEKWEEWLALCVGGWLVVSPSLLGYSGLLQISHVLLGALIAGVAALEIWQDRNAKA